MSALNPTSEGEQQVIVRSDGITESERYLKKLCDNSFLSLWSCPGVFRDQGRIDKKGDGKEVCDLLVVFENHIIIFSDKHIQFKDSGDLQTDWRRWFTKAVCESAMQVWGAERWVRDNPQRLYLDSGCEVPFPIDLPRAGNVIFHRIVVAHDASRRCRERLGGSGSLMINSSLLGDQHFSQPFTIGHINPTKGYVHVFDDTTLDVVMTTLDTVSDFVAYLSKKEALLTSNTIVRAAGEEELLAEYVAEINKDGDHDFVIPTNTSIFGIMEGGWARFLASPERKAQVAANEISYVWDTIIEKFAKHLMSGTQVFFAGKINEQEKSFRWLARENRTRRRLLARAFLTLIENTPADHRATRVMMPSRPGDPYYVFLLFPRFPNLDETDCRQARGEMLRACCQVVKLTFPDAQHIVGIATESGLGGTRSEDFCHFDASHWDEEAAKEAKSLQRDLGLLTKTKTFAGRELEYPTRLAPHATYRNISRNSPCYCNSGKRYKRCHGAGLFAKRRRT
jgi:hypothetical protein